MISDLVERAQRGDHEAFDALATAAYHRLYAIARRILRDGYAAEDVVQDAFVRIHTAERIISPEGFLIRATTVTWSNELISAMKC